MNKMITKNMTNNFSLITIMSLYTKFITNSKTVWASLHSGALLGKIWGPLAYISRSLLCPG